MEWSAHWFHFHVGMAKAKDSKEPYDAGEDTNLVQVAFRLPKELIERLDLALTVLGWSRSELLVALVRDHLDTLVEEALRERRSAEQQFFAERPPPRKKG